MATDQRSSSCPSIPSNRPDLIKVCCTNKSSPFGNILDCLCYPQPSFLYPGKSGKKHQPKHSSLSSTAAADTSISDSKSDQSSVKGDVSMEIDRDDDGDYSDSGEELFDDMEDGEENEMETELLEYMDPQYLDS